MNWSDLIPDNFNVHDFFDAVVRQDAEKLRTFFEPDALIFWTNTNEQFTVDEYIRVNCEYPGKWNGHIDEWHIIAGYEKKMVFEAKVWNDVGAASRTVSIISFGDTENELIQQLVECWGDVSEPPEWRQKMNIGKRYKDYDNN